MNRGKGVTLRVAELVVFGLEQAMLDRVVGEGRQGCCYLLHAVYERDRTQAPLEVLDAGQDLNCLHCIRLFSDC